MVLFDREAIRGLTLTQLADYATFRALAQRLPAAAAGEASILALFDSGAAQPAALTEFDRAYLARLYTGLPNLPAPAKLADLARATGANPAE